MLLGLVIFQMDFVIIMTMIGIISLAGVVVNNAIVLIDYTDLIRERKRRDQNVDSHLPFSEVVESIVSGAHPFAACIAHRHYNRPRLVAVGNRLEH